MTQDPNNPQAPPHALDELREKLAPHARELGFQYGQIRKQGRSQKGWGWVAMLLLDSESRDEYLAGLKEGSAPTIEELIAQMKSDLDGRLQQIETRSHEIRGRLTILAVIQIVMALTLLGMWLR